MNFHDEIDHPSVLNRILPASLPARGASSPWPHWSSSSSRLSSGQWLGALPPSPDWLRLACGHGSSRIRKVARLDLHWLGWAPDWPMRTPSTFPPSVFSASRHLLSWMSVIGTLAPWTSLSPRCLGPRRPRPHQYQKRRWTWTRELRWQMKLMLHLQSCFISRM